MSELQKRPSIMTAEEFEKWLECDPENSEKSEDGNYLHVPIAFLEPDLRYTFEGKMKIKIKHQIQMFGGVIMHIRLKVFHPVHKIWLKYDGTAAIIIESERPGEFKGSSKTLIVDDLKTGIASCYSECIKNAAKKIGKRFGSDLNRVNKPGKVKSDKKEVKKKAVDSRVQAMINDCQTISELNAIMPELPNTEEVQKALNVKLKQLKLKK